MAAPVPQKTINAETNTEAKNDKQDTEDEKDEEDDENEDDDIARPIWDDDDPPMEFVDPSMELMMNKMEDEIKLPDYIYLNEKAGKLNWYTKAFEDDGNYRLESPAFSHRQLAILSELNSLEFWVKARDGSLGEKMMVLSHSYLAFVSRTAVYISSDHGELFHWIYSQILQHDPKDASVTQPEPGELNMRTLLRFPTNAESANYGWMSYFHNVPYIIAIYDKTVRLWINPFIRHKFWKEYNEQTPLNSSDDFTMRNPYNLSYVYTFWFIEKEAQYVIAWKPLRNLIISYCQLVVNVIKQLAINIIPVNESYVLFVSDKFIIHTTQEMIADFIWTKDLAEDLKYILLITLLRNTAQCIRNAALAEPMKCKIFLAQMENKDYMDPAYIEAADKYYRAVLGEKPMINDFEFEDYTKDHMVYEQLSANKKTLRKNKPRSNSLNDSAPKQKTNISSYKKRKKWKPPRVNDINKWNEYNSDRSDNSEK